MNTDLLNNINQIDVAIARGLVGAALSVNTKRTLREHCAHLRAGLVNREDITTQQEAAAFVADCKRIFGTAA